MLFVRIIKTYRDVVAICDKELLGRKFEEGNFRLDAKESFYKGEDGVEYSEVEAIKIMRRMAMEDATFNIVGKESTEAAIKAEIISEGDIQEIQGIPFALKLI